MVVLRAIFAFRVSVAYACLVRLSSDTFFAERLGIRKVNGYNGSMSVAPYVVHVICLLFC